MNGFKRSQIYGIRSASISILLICCYFLITGCQSNNTGSAVAQATIPVPLRITPILTPPPSQRDLSATKVALIQAEQATQIAANHWPTITPKALPTLKPIATPVPGLNGACGDGDSRYVNGGCWSGHVGNDYLFLSSNALSDNPEQSWLEVYTGTQTLHELGPRQTYPVPGNPGLLHIAYVAWPHAILITINENAPNTQYVFNLVTRSWETPSSCPILPLAAQIGLISGIHTRDIISSTITGSNIDKIGWLTWNGDIDDTTLAHSFSLPGDSTAYRNPNNPADQTLTVGDWVSGRLPAGNGPVADALVSLLKSGARVVVPVWDQVNGVGSHPVYHITDFAWVSFSRYTPTAPQIELRYWGRARCPASP